MGPWYTIRPWMIGLSAFPFEKVSCKFPAFNPFFILTLFMYTAASLISNSRYYSCAAYFPPDFSMTSISAMATTSPIFISKTLWPGFSKYIWVTEMSPMRIWGLEYVSQFWREDCTSLRNRYVFRTCIVPFRWWTCIGLGVLDISRTGRGIGVVINVDWSASDKSLVLTRHR